MAVESKDLFVEVPGGQVFIRQWNIDGASGSPIILLHDSLGSVEQWRSFPEALAARTNRDVIAYDRLGFGKSTGRTGPAQAGFIDEEAQVYLPAIVAALGLSHYILFGHSVGGGMALVAAANPGSHCAAVITEAAQAFVEERTLSGIRDAKKAFENEAQFSKLTKVMFSRWLKAFLLMIELRNGECTRTTIRCRRGSPDGPRAAMTPFRQGVTVPKRSSEATSNHSWPCTQMRATSRQAIASNPRSRSLVECEVAFAGGVPPAEAQVIRFAGRMRPTIRAAEQYGEQGARDSLEVGKLTDLVILDRDPPSPRISRRPAIR